ncbi:lysophospholipid acyltransferase family protein [Hyphobacterium sp.]|uniref:lysophospholipid acyltransferase family protein n=1 Tax=Hyphobacterium sp. TaxID=2004662 RepID=UPI003BAA5B95
MLHSSTISSLFLSGFSWLLAKYMQFCVATKRWEYIGLENRDACMKGGEGLIGAFWHSRITLAYHAIDRTAPQTVTILISRSKEGEIIARFSEHLQMKTVRGSSQNFRKSKSKGGMTAFREMVRVVENKDAMAITIDGPRGPRQRASMGVIQLAKATGQPILPFTWSATHKKVFNSWDRFFLPFPFGKAVMMWLDPLYVPGDADEAQMEALRLQLEERLNAATREADEKMGGPTSEPAEPRKVKGARA